MLRPNRRRCQKLARKFNCSVQAYVVVAQIEREFADNNNDHDDAEMEMKMKMEKAPTIQSLFSFSQTLFLLKRENRLLTKKSGFTTSITMEVTAPLNQQHPSLPFFPFQELFWFGQTKEAAGKALSGNFSSIAPAY